MATTSLRKATTRLPSPEVNRVLYVGVSFINADATNSSNDVDDGGRRRLRSEDVRGEGNRYWSQSWAAESEDIAPSKGF
ncbi:uncharacterized protein A4U43_C09F9350 [Asparagus officinalis]|uniref:Uncharacterized protein n=1 Tax=Asparagus officinalis TaxID=4686 RepID=A0A5P1E9L8_ASPOF|nr:uncharacterized protein A4U43_C09F9350 [Asparagus officinalis]